MSPGEYNLIIYKGSDFSFTVNLKDSQGNAIDLTGYTGKGSIKLKATDATPIAEFDVDVTNEAAGEITIQMLGTESAKIETQGVAYNKYLKSYYDIVITKDKTYRILHGQALISPSITVIVE